MLILDSENPETEGSDYYGFQIVQDWEGWREFRLPLAELGATRQPLGWHAIQSATFTASGWGNTAHPDGVVTLADWKLTDEHRYGPLMDDAAFFAANSLVEEVFLLTVSFNIYLLRPIVDGILEAHGRVTHRTGRLFFAESSAVAQDGTVIATGSGTFMRSRILLTPEIGYR